MRRVYIVIAAASVAAIILAGCAAAGADAGTGGSNGADAPQDDGTVTVSVSGTRISVSLSGASGDNWLWAWLYTADEWNLDDPETILAAGSQQISDGTASFVLKESDGSFGYTEVEWQGTGGSTYDLYFMTALESGGPLDEGMKTTADMPVSITMDGDKTVDVAMVDYVPTTGTLTVTLSGAVAENGKLFAVAVWDEGDGPWANEPIDGTFEDATITAGTATVQIVPWVGMQAATQYDVFIFIFMDQRPEGPVPGEDMLYKGEPVAWWVDGDRTMLPEYGDFEVIPEPQP